MYHFYPLLCILFITTSAYEIVQDSQGQPYYLIPVPSTHRHKRETSINIAKGSPGTRLTATQSGTIINSNGHRLDGTAFASKQFRPSGPTTAGGQLGYSHAPSGSNFNIGAQHTPKFGTDVRATGTANIWSSGNQRLDTVGSYGRHFGGLWGTGHPNYYAGLEYKIKYHY